MTDKEPYIFQIDLPILPQIERKTTFYKDKIVVYIRNCTNYNLDTSINIKLFIKNEFKEENDYLCNILANNTHELVIGFISILNDTYNLEASEYDNNKEALKLSVQVSTNDKRLNYEKYQDNIQYEAYYIPESQSFNIKNLKV
ncbi:MAG: hypothetical protein HOC71_17955 [Candidatus Latescibacteria bacterium]|jgi:hypothetical protein|nr:hypothetical protein [Candidatus Latescibacterota bacterium]